MKVFVVLSCIVLVTAKPQNGYSYSQPQQHHHASSFLSAGSQGSAQLAAPSFGSQGSAFGSQGSAFGSQGSAQLAAPSFGLNAPAAGPAPSFSAAPSFAAPTSSFVGPAPAPSFQSFSQPQQTVVQKHIYVHVPPADQEEIQAQQQLAQQPIISRQKHYKIIFIKAPSAPSYSKQVIQQQLQQSQSEEKTLVYVLVKKPESHEDIQRIIAAQPAPAPVSKPEVYFIKYKAQKEEQNFAPGAPSFTPAASLPQISALASTAGSSIQSFPAPAQPSAPLAPAPSAPAHISAPKPVYGPPH